MFARCRAVCESSLARICLPAVSCGSAHPEAAQTVVRVQNCVFVRVLNCAASVQSIQRATHRVAPTLPAGRVCSVE
jgi:hypothetical protein